MCFSEGEIQSYIDNELDLVERRKLKKHLIICSNCRNIYKELKSNQKFAEQKLMILFKNQKMENKKGGFILMVRKYKKTLTTLVASLLIVCLLAFTPVGKAASEALKIFRVSTVQPIIITPEDIQSIRETLKNGNINGNIDLKQFGTLNIKDQGREEFTSIKDLKQKVGFDVKIPQLDNYKLNKAIWEKPKEINFSLNIKAINNTLKMLKAKKLFPAELDKKTFTVSFKNAVTFLYSIPQEQSNEINKNFIEVIELQSPDLILPDGINVYDIRDTLLSLPFLPDNIKKQLYAINDFKNTLPVPVNSESQVKKVNINGYEGIYVEEKNDLGTNNMLIWVDKNNVVFNINANNLTYETLLQIANSLR